MKPTPRGSHGVLAVADQRALALDEHQRLFRRLELQLLRVVGVVQAERQDGAWNIT
jgi:hypothetical protein